MSGIDGGEQPVPRVGQSNWRRWRVLILPLAALIILGLVEIRRNRRTDPPTEDDIRDASLRKPASLFTLYDVDSRPFKLSQYLGRHKMIVVFFDSRQSALEEPQLKLLAQSKEEFANSGIKIVAVGTATPWANRNKLGKVDKLPFNLVSDADMTVHMQWGCVQGEPPVVKPTIFILDRAGVIRWSRPTTPEPKSIEEIKSVLWRIP